MATVGDQLAWPDNECASVPWCACEGRRPSETWEDRAVLKDQQTAEILSIHSFQPSSICSVREGKGFSQVCEALAAAQSTMQAALHSAEVAGTASDAPDPAPLIRAGCERRSSHWALAQLRSHLADLKTLLHLTAETEDKKQGQTRKGLTPGPTSYPVQD